MKAYPKLTLLLVWFLTLAGIVISAPAKIPLYFKLGQWQVNTVIDRTVWLKPWNKVWDLQTGLDIRGGSHMIFAADMTGIADQDRPTSLEAAKLTIERRVNLLGVSEAVVQTSQQQGQYRLIVELPGVTDVTSAVQLIGQTAQLDFRKPTEATDSAVPFDRTELSGRDLVRAGVDFDNNTGQPVVNLEFNGDGAKKFADLTTTYVGKQIAIFLDEQVISAPVVNTPITTGQAIITGEFTIDQAKQLAIQLNSGALPVPIKLLSQRTVGASLGQDTVQKSVVGGLIGLGMVMIFMVAYYGWLGLLANIGLVIYGVMTLALYKLWGVTLTLPGIAGFILSVGMAVDANILIFERFKEELRLQRPRRLAIELAFGRAWDSIRDANVCTLIACFVLFNPLNWPFLNTSGPVRGFALTLTLGIVISLFTGIVVTRSLIRVFYLQKNR